METKDVLPDDILVSMHEETRDDDKVWDDECDSSHVYRLVLKVKRWTDETDAEYSARMQALERQSKFVEQKEKLEYLRLKAKFEDINDVNEPT